MSAVNRFVDCSSKFILIIVGLAIALLPVLHILANESLHRQQWNPDFERYQSRGQEIEAVLGMEFGELYLRNYTGKGKADDVREVGRLADYVCYRLMKRGDAVVRKNLEVKNKKKMKKGSQNELIYDLASVSTLVQVPPLAFLKKQIAKYIDFEHQSLRRKHWVIVIFGEVEDKVRDEVESIKEANPNYKFTIINPERPSIEAQKQRAKGSNIQQNQLQPKQKKQKSGKGKKSEKIRKLEVVQSKQGSEEGNSTKNSSSQAAKADDL